MNRKKVFSINNLKLLSDSNIKFHTANGIDKMNYKSFKNQEYDLLKNIRKKVHNNTYKFTKYKEKLLVKDRYSIPRCISIPTLTDRICLKACHELLGYKFPEATTMPLPQECIKKISREQNEYDYFIKIDISNFYGSINHYRLFSILNSKIKDEPFLNLLKNAIETPTYPDNKVNMIGLPQGLSISNILSHIYMLDFDQKYKENNDISFIRYVDDILILCKSSEKEAIKEKVFYDIKRNCMLTTNDKKFKEGYLLTETFTFLGYSTVINNSNFLLSIPENKINDMQNRIIDKITKYNRTKNIKGNAKAKETFIFEFNLMITGALSKKVTIDTLKTRRYGWIFFYSQLTDLTILYKLDAFIDKKLKEYFLKDELTYLQKNIKSFSRSHYESKYNLNNSNYFFQPDKYNTEEQKTFLEATYNLNILKEETSENISKLFRKYVYKKVKEENEDVLHGMS
ncbi:MAG: reverse transcriptase domain-containing protein [Carnobacterium sp.]|uniref:reverse transcriptase domain-containing protein n=1 Tax=Carnobacterium sp. TaxID=48221 RepID=UPI003C72D497